MNRIRVVIVEDEKIAAANLEKLAVKVDPDIQVIAILSSVQQAIQWFMYNVADLVFMDIQLGDGQSFKIFENVSIKSPVIFTTAYDQYAIKAFKTNGIDYLLKPIDENELAASVKKFRDLTQKDYNHTSLQDIIHYLGNVPEYKQRFMVQAGHRIRSIPAGEIAYFYFTEKVVFLCTYENRKFPIDYSLDKLEDFINPEIFFRINRRIIVSIEAISKIYSLSKSRIKLELKPEFEDEVLVSFNKTPSFRTWLNK